MHEINNKIIRLYIFKSNKHIYANIIDNKNNNILTSCSTISKEIKNQIKFFKSCINARIVGKHIAIKLKKKGIKKIIFDRGKNIYHGQVKALADSIRKEGIIF
uniref:Large ribosomal subunit protein uL18c n=1 Tax=Choreocolax polysiphoniae TaxID=282351 RepID=A0A0B5VQG9_9FLOR|nr:50S ribosomal protein L18 [Choreocolax polysiphoniae]AJH65857.1 50S ribosomal protein L18 [Choreocolax polysiphoniae]